MLAAWLMLLAVEPLCRVGPVRRAGGVGIAHRRGAAPLRAALDARPGGRAGDKLRRANKELHGLALRGKHQSAIKLLGRMREEGVRPSVVSHNHVLKALSVAGRQEELLAALGRMEAGEDGIPRPNVYTYSIAISCLAKAGDAAAARDAFGRMVSGGIAPNVFAYSALIDAYGRSGDWQRAMRVLADMHDRGIAPNTVALNSVLSACATAGEAAVALTLLDEMLRHGDGDGAGLGADLEGELLSGADVPPELAAVVARGALGEGADGVSFSTAISALERSQRFSALLALVHHMEGLARGGRRAGRALFTIFTFGSYLHACSELGEGGLAAAMLQRMEVRHGTPPDAVCFASAISALGKARDHRRALLVFEQLLPRYDVPVDRHILSATIAACAVPADDAWRDGLRLYREHTGDGRVPPNSFVAASAAQACAAGGRMDLALDVLSDAKRVGAATTRVYNAVIAAALRTAPPPVAAARRLLAELKAPGGAGADTVTYGTLMAVEAAAGGDAAADRVLALLREMEAAGVAPNARVHAVALRALASGRERWADGVAVVKGALARGCRAGPALVDPLVQCALNCEAPPLKEAFQLVEALEKVGSPPSAAALTALLGALADIGGAAGAWDEKERLRAGLRVLRMLRRAAPLAFPTREATRLVTACEQVGAWKEALHALQEIGDAGVKFYEVEILDSVFRRLLRTWGKVIDVDLPERGAEPMRREDLEMVLRSLT